jgi:hypothetical protein
MLHVLGQMKPLLQSIKKFQMVNPCVCYIFNSMFCLIELPYNDYFEYYGPDFKLNITPSNMPNQNSGDYLDRIK